MEMTFTQPNGTRAGHYGVLEDSLSVWRALGLTGLEMKDGSMKHPTKSNTGRSRSEMSNFALR